MTRRYVLDGGRLPFCSYAYSALVCKCIYVILYVRINTRAYGVRVGLNAICEIIVTLAARRHYVLHIHVYIASTIVRLLPVAGAPCSFDLSPRTFAASRPWLLPAS